MSRIIITNDFEWKRFVQYDFVSRGHSWENGLRGHGMFENCNAKEGTCDIGRKKSQRTES